MEIPTALAIALVCTALATAITWLILRQQASVLAERLRTRDEEISRLAAELDALRASATQLSSLNSQLQSDLASAKAAATAKLAADEQAEKLKASLQTEFQAVAAKLLDEKSAKFTEHNRSQVDALLTPLRQQLADFRQRVDLVYKTDGEDRTALKTQIEQLRQLNVRITDEARALTHALKGQSQARGAWGELILERLLDSAGLVKGQDYLTQESLVTDDGRRLRPDIILRLPDARHLVIDSKISLIAYERAANAATDADRLAAAADHARAVRTHVDQLSEKRYEDTGKLVTPDYVFMFVPLEPAFTLALEHDRSLYEYAFARRVILCTAPTLLVTLKTVAQLWKQDRQTKNVQAIAERGGALYDKFAGLVSDLEAIGQQLAKTRELHDAAMNKLSTGRGNLIAQVEDLKTLGAKAKKSLPSAPPEVS